MYSSYNNGNHSFAPLFACFTSVTIRVCRTETDRSGLTIKNFYWLYQVSQKKTSTYIKYMVCNFISSARLSASQCLEHEWLEASTECEENTPSSPTPDPPNNTLSVTNKPLSRAPSLRVQQDKLDQKDRKYFGSDYSNRGSFTQNSIGRK